MIVVFVFMERQKNGRHIACCGMESVRQNEEFIIFKKCFYLSENKYKN